MPTIPVFVLQYDVVVEVRIVGSCASLRMELMQIFVLLLFCTFS